MFILNGSFAKSNIDAIVGLLSFMSLSFSSIVKGFSSIAKRPVLPTLSKNFVTIHQQQLLTLDLLYEYFFLILIKKHS